MEKERANFVYGNEEEGRTRLYLQGHQRGRLQSKIYDEMMDFAKYAFNKSHAACYAVVAYQTAYLKYYYPVEFMAALMTSVIDNPREGVRIYPDLQEHGHYRCCPPDINEGEAGFLCIRELHPLCADSHQERGQTGD